MTFPINVQKVRMFLSKARTRLKDWKSLFEVLGIAYLLSTYVLNFIIMLFLSLGKEVVIVEHSRLISSIEILTAIVFLPFVVKAVKKVLFH